MTESHSCVSAGKFTAGMEVYHVQGGKQIKLAQPQQMMADERKIVEEAYAGDIIGIFDPGIFSIGDTLTTAKEKFRFKGDPDVCTGAFCACASDRFHEA